MKCFIDPNFVREKFIYNPEDGILRFRIDYGSSGRFKANSPAGAIARTGGQTGQKPYLRVTLAGKRGLYVHRLIWVYMTGEQPDTVDHIDGDGLNNKWSNLRNVTHRENAKNQKLFKNNTSGVSGVCFRKDSGKWRSLIKV